jgi:hypothetical protein
MPPQVRLYQEHDKQAVHTLFVSGMKDNQNALILEAIKNIPGKHVRLALCMHFARSVSRSPSHSVPHATRNAGVKEACVGVPVLALALCSAARQSHAGRGISLPWTLLCTCAAATAIPLAVTIKLWSSLRDYVSHSLCVPSASVSLFLLLSI